MIHDSMGYAAVDRGMGFNTLILKTDILATSENVVADMAKRFPGLVHGGDYRVIEVLIERERKDG